MERLEPILSSLPAGGRAFVEKAIAIWIAGDWAMVGIAAVAFILFGLGMRIWVRLLFKRYAIPRDRTVRKWLANASLRRGEAGRLLDEIDGIDDVHVIGTVFESLHAREIAPFARDLKIIRVCVTAAPLLGLFGTVTGMLATFDALASGSGGEQTMGKIAAGISEALITTETGLVVALPGVFFQYLISRGVARYEASFEHLESLCMQAAWRRTHPSPGNTDPDTAMIPHTTETRS
jgi:biopolymer transport protein ExbB